MIGVKHSILSLFAAITIYSVIVAGFECPGEGLYRYEEDINQFYSCMKAGDTADLLPCPKDRGFIKNGEITGCVPFDQWNCTNKDGDKPPNCSDENVYELLHAHVNPNYFWACPQPIGTEAVIVKCKDGRGFIKSNENYGCLPWSEWKCSDIIMD